MNEPCRKELRAVREQIESIKDYLTELKEGEEERRDSIPDCFQGSERYLTSDQACDDMDSATK